MDDQDARREVRVSAPGGVAPSDRRLVEWVAQASIGDPIPQPWSWASAPLESMVRTLVQLGVIGKPQPEDDLATIAREASAAAQRWLDEHPAAGRPGRPPQ